jgi:amino-acid N-acetyltransferase
VTVIERAEPIDRRLIEDLLEANHLPLAGLDRALSAAVVAREIGAVVGCAAVEPYGSVGLLRSVCVTAERRGAGLGRRLVAEAETLAAGRGIAELYLLTETAAAWFPALGYEPAPRAEAPAAITVSAEFTAACPASAVMMRKRLNSKASEAPAAN